MENLDGSHSFVGSSDTTETVHMGFYVSSCNASHSIGYVMFLVAYSLIYVGIQDRETQQWHTTYTLNTSTIFFNMQNKWCGVNA